MFSLVESEEEEEEENKENEQCCLPPWAVEEEKKSKKRLSKQMSIKESTREAMWEKRRKQIRRRRAMERMVKAANESIEETEVSGAQRRERVRSLTDEDLDELRGFIDLGFSFDEESDGHELCNVLPALDLYFAVNRQFSDSRFNNSPSPGSTPTTVGGRSSCSLLGSPSPRSPNQHNELDSRKILNPGDSPEHIKTRLRHWAQVVACSIRQLQQYT